MASVPKGVKGIRSNVERGKGEGKIGRSCYARYSSSVYLSDNERSTFLQFAGGHNISRAIQYAARAIGTLQKRK